MFHPDGPTFVELARQALSSTVAGYDLLAPKFDHTPFRTPDDVIDATLQRAEQALDGDIELALDACCGTGAALRLLRPRAKRLIGVDLSQGMLDEARRRSRDWAGAGKVELVQGDVMDLNHRDVDLICSFGAFGHILERDERRFVAQIRQMLRPGGVFAFATTELPPPWAPRRLLAHAFNGAMRIRNLVWSPPFIMYYLTFTLPACAALLEREGFRVAVHDPQLVGLAPIRVVVAAKTP